MRIWGIQCVHHDVGLGVPHERVLLGALDLLHRADVLRGDWEVSTVLTHPLHPDPPPRRLGFGRTWMLLAAWTGLE